MGLGTGFISAILVARKHFRKNKTKLQRLQQKLSKTPLQKSVFYEIPLKCIILTVITISLILFFNYFQQNYLLELLSLKSRSKAQVMQQIKGAEQNYGNLCKVIKIMKICYMVIIFIIASQFKLKIVVIEPTGIEIIQYSHSKMGERKVIAWKDGYIIKIVRKGEQRFSNNTSYYSLEIINKQEEGYNYQELLKRSNIFHAKKNMIEIGSIMNFVPDLQVH